MLPLPISVALLLAGSLLSPIVQAQTTIFQCTIKGQTEFRDTPCSEQAMARPVPGAEATADCKGLDCMQQWVERISGSAKEGLDQLNPQQLRDAVDDLQHWLRKRTQTDTPTPQAGDRSACAQLRALLGASKGVAQVQLRATMDEQEYQGFMQDFRRGLLTLCPAE